MAILQQSQRGSVCRPVVAGVYQYLGKYFDHSDGEEVVGDVVIFNVTGQVENDPNEEVSQLALVVFLGFLVEQSV